MSLSEQFQACLFVFCFFYKRLSRAQISNRVKVVCFTFWCFLCARNLLVKKKNKQTSRLEIVLITSFYYTTDVYPYQPTYRTSIYTHLLLFLTIYKNLFKSFLCVIIRENLLLKIFMKISKRMNTII